MVVLALHRVAPDQAVITEARAKAALLSAPYGAGGLRLFSVGALPPTACRSSTDDSLARILRCTPAVNEALASCGEPRFKLVVLSQERFTSRSSVVAPGENAGVFVSVSGDDFGWVRELQHELAHAFGLRDERESLLTPQKSLAATPGPNCAASRAEAERRWGDLARKGQAGFFPGCAGHKEWLRPHERTIMGRPRVDASFGAVSARYLSLAARCCFTSDRTGCAEAAARDPELQGCLK